ncbi:MAG: cohesin domain-containing protein [Euryarchaeota archaeon]|nr:cohesin domain-containing protein [Euryarchaeota archaeon]
MISKIIPATVIILMVSIILATPVAADSTGVSLNAPERMEGDFSVAIDIENVADLDSGQFDLYFDPAAVRVVRVDDGNIGGTTIPIDNWAAVGENAIRLLFNLPGIDGASGSGSLATVHFETIVPGNCAMELSNGLLVDTMAEEISVSWNGVESAATETGATTPVDETGCKTPGFGALFVICAIATVIFAFRREK